MPSTPPRCETLVGCGPLSSWISPVMATWKARSSKHRCPLDSVIIGSFLMTTLSLKLTLSPMWHDLVTWMTRLALSSLTPLFLSVSVIWLTWHYHMCDIRTEMMTMLDAFCLTTIISSSTEFCHVCLCADFNKLVSEWNHHLQIRKCILSFIVTVHNISYFACYTLHVTHCMLHLNTCIDVLVSNILLFVLFREFSDNVGSNDPSSCSLCW